MAKLQFTDVDSFKIDILDLKTTTINNIINIVNGVDGFRLSDGRYFDKTGFVNVDFYNDTVEVQINFED